jgi:hypothetical protein
MIHSGRLTPLEERGSGDIAVCGGKSDFIPEPLSKSNHASLTEKKLLVHVGE